MRVPLNFCFFARRDDFLMLQSGIDSAGWTLVRARAGVEISLRRSRAVLPELQLFDQGAKQNLEKVGYYREAEARGNYQAG